MSGIEQRAIADIGGYFLQLYGAREGVLAAPNAVSALGAVAGVFAQFQARALLAAGVLQNSESSLIEVRTADGAAYYFGDALNACLLEGDAARPAFWNYVAAIAGEAAVAEIDVGEIARHTADALGGPGFGVPRMPAPFAPSEAPRDAVKRHVPPLAGRFEALELPPERLMHCFGAAAQGLALFAAGEEPALAVDAAMPRAAQARLLMEAAVPMSKLDFAIVSAEG